MNVLDTAWAEKRIANAYLYDRVFKVGVRRIGPICLMSECRYCMISAASWPWWSCMIGSVYHLCTPKSWMSPCDRISLFVNRPVVAQIVFIRFKFGLLIAPTQTCAITDTVFLHVNIWMSLRKLKDIMWICTFPRLRLSNWHGATAFCSNFQFDCF